MPENILRVTVKGKDHAGWKTIDVFRDMEELVGSFKLEMIDLKKGEALPLIRAGDDCLVSIQATPQDDPFVIMTGFVDSASASLDEKGVRFSISGRDKTADLVDCAVTQASEWKNIKFEDFVEDVIRPFPLEVVLDSAIDTGPEIETINYDQGTKIFELIAKHAQLKQLILYTLPDGRILITRASTERITPDGSKSQMTAFVEGVNILSAKAISDWSEVYSDYIVKGSRQSTPEDATEEEATQIEGCTLDTRITRFRPLIIIPDGELNNVSAKQRSQWEATVRIARAEGYSIVRQGWQPEINRLAPLELPFAGFKGDMLIKSHRLIADENGKRTEFVFVHPRSFAPLEADDVIADDKDTALADIKITTGIITLAGGGVL